MIKKIIAYIFRSWEDEITQVPNRLKILPPFLFEVLVYLIGLSILYQIIAYLWRYIQ